jgi:protocatechuate 3,4-dioxygenase alpha subunit
MSKPEQSSAATRLVATPSQTVGPFFHFACGTDPALGRLTVPGLAGEPIRLRVRVLDGDGAPVNDALVEIYQADASGRYPRGDEAPASGFSGFGRLATDTDGVCVFETIRPGAVAGATGATQAPHVNICLFARGLLHHLYTRAYFDGDAALSNDPVLACVPADRRDTLTARREAAGLSTWTFDIHLQGDRETVFFDL